MPPDAGDVFHLPIAVFRDKSCLMFRNDIGFPSFIMLNPDSIFSLKCFFKVCGLASLPMSVSPPFSVLTVLFGCDFTVLHITHLQTDVLHDVAQYFPSILYPKESKLPKDSHENCLAMKVSDSSGQFLSFLLLSSF